MRFQTSKFKDKILGKFYNKGSTCKDFPVAKTLISHKTVNSVSQNDERYQIDVTIMIYYYK